MKQFLIVILINWPKTERNKKSQSYYSPSKLISSQYDDLMSRRVHRSNNHWPKFDSRLLLVSNGLQNFY
jgi:hypothetical protein